MRISPRLKSQQELVIYPRLLWAGKKQLLLGVPVSLLFIIGGIFTIVTGQGENIRIEAWVGVLFFSFILFALIVQLTWGPFLIINEQEIHIRPNPFLSPIKIQWNEIASISTFRGPRDFYFDITLSPTHIEAFLQRQSPLNKKFLKSRLNRIHQIVHFPQRLLPCSLITLLEAIQEEYNTQLQQHHIIIEI